LSVTTSDTASLTDVRVEPNGNDTATQALRLDTTDVLSHVQLVLVQKPASELTIIYSYRQRDDNTRGF